MTFVNRIASIVHTNVVKFGGSPNKNIGDAFLFVWKLASQTEEPAFFAWMMRYLDGESDELTEEEALAVSVIVDLSVYSILKILAKINSYKQILAYWEHKGLNDRMNNYAVWMGFGLHLGWSIEGLIGSPHKVDASYLSPHVSISAHLEGGTKTFGVNWLLSEVIFDLMSNAYKALCWMVDICLIKGQEKPMWIYTLETQTENLPKQKDRFLKLAVKSR